MKKTLTLLSLLVLLAWQQAVMAANATVTVGANGANSFSPAAVTINAGDMVTWQWSSGTHTIQSDSSPAAWATANSDAGHTTFSHTFSAAGVYPYHCTVHGASMSGTVTVLSISGTKEDVQQNKLMNIYPNPARDQFKLTFNGNTVKGYEVKVTNAIGKVVKTIPAEDLKNAMSNNLEVDVTTLPSGLYFYTLWNSDKMIETRRLIIQK